MADGIQKFRKEFDDYSNDDLLKKIGSHHPTSHERIAAKQILAERQAKTEDSRHKESLAESRKANRMSIFAILIAIVSLIVAIVALILSQ